MISQHNNCVEIFWKTFWLLILHLGEKKSDETRKLLSKFVDKQPQINPKALKAQVYDSAKARVFISAKSSRKTSKHN